MMAANQRLIVLSGCSAGGKSTLLDEMSRRGVRVCPEPGRRIVEQQEAAGGDGLPWDDQQKFLQLCAELAVEDFLAAQGSRGVTLFDRSLVDAVAGFVRLAKEQAAPEIAANYLPLLERYRYAQAVLLAPPWPELFHAGGADEHRKHSFDSAVAEFEHLREYYPKLGYSVTELPRGTVVQRADYLSKLVAAAS